MSVLKKIQPNRSSRLADYTQHIYKNVLFYYIEDKQFGKGLILNLGTILFVLFWPFFPERPGIN